VLVASWGPAELALLGACEGTAGIVGYLSRGLSAFFLPKMSHAAESPRRLRTMVAKSIMALVPIAVVCLLPACLIGDWILATLYSSAYRGLSGPLIICFLSASLGLIGVPVNQAVHALQRSDIGFKALVCSLPLSLCLGSVLTWRFGLWGACISTLLGVAGALAHRSIFLVRHLSRGQGSAVDRSDLPETPLPPRVALGCPGGLL
jgi:O-antigen/teichoic acid export membrane protein